MENYLVHHGILGQKWGIRRYQNPDGTLTEAGKKRYSAGYGYDGSLTKEEAESKKSWRKKNRDKYYNVLRSEIDTSKLKGKAKAEKEMSLLKQLSDEDASEREIDRSEQLLKRIKKESGNWDWYTAKSSGFQDFLDKDEALAYNMLIKYEVEDLSDIPEYRKERAKIIDELAGVVLKDIGYENTEQARELLKRAMPWDLKE